MRVGRTGVGRREMDIGGGGGGVLVGLKALCSTVTVTMDLWRSYESVYDTYRGGDFVT